MVSPEVPRGSPVRQAVFDHEAHRQGQDALGAVAARRGPVGHRDTDVKVARGTVVPGVRHLEDLRAIARRTAEVMHRSTSDGVPVARSLAPGAAAAAIVTRPLGLRRRGEVFDAGDPFDTAGEVLSRSVPHGRLLHAEIRALQQN
jgi:hypothetical protein